MSPWLEVALTRALRVSAELGRSYVGADHLVIDSPMNHRNVEARELSYAEDDPFRDDADLVALPIVPFIGIELIPGLI